jgi:sulfide dehydrogenase cytochrome subunit
MLAIAGRNRSAGAQRQEDSMRRTRFAALVIALAAATAYAQAPDPNLGRNVAASCANCHGTDGVSQGTIPSLAGQSRQDIVTKMKEFKAGTRPATIMQQLAKGYTDEQIERAAAYFAAQKR